MTRISRIALALWLAVFCLLTAPAHAQTTVDSTTFSSAVSATDDVVNLTAASGAAAGGYLYTQSGELMAVRSVSSAAVTVRRGLGEGFTPARAHTTTEKVWVGSGAEFEKFSRGPGGSCTASGEQYLPRFDTKANRIFDCQAGVWVERIYSRMMGGPVVFNRTGIKATYTVLPTDYYIEATSWTGGLTINLPANITTLGTGFVLYIRDGVGLAVGSPSGRTITVNPSIPSNGGSIDGASSQTISTAFGILRLIVGVDNTGNFQWLQF